MQRQTLQYCAETQVGIMITAQATCLGQKGKAVPWPSPHGHSDIMHTDTGYRFRAWDPPNHPLIQQ